MEAEDTLLTLAEVAVALAGFSGVVTAFQTRGRPWSRFDSVRLWNLLRFSLALLFFSLLPLAWLAAGESPWVVCSAVFGLTAAGQAIVSASFAIRRPPGTQPVVAASLAAGGLAAAIALSLNTLGVLFERSFTGYLVGLLWLVVASAVFFVRLVYLGLADVHEERD